jgi:hypothetical protein
MTAVRNVRLNGRGDVDRVWQSSKGSSSDSPYIITFIDIVRRTGAFSVHGATDHVSRDLTLRK